MKTLIIFNNKFLIADGDFSRFNGVIVNGLHGNGFEDEFCDFAFDKEDGGDNFEWSNDISLIENKEWDKVAICTYIY